MTAYIQKNKYNLFTKIFFVIGFCYLYFYNRDMDSIRELLGDMFFIYGLLLFYIPLTTIFIFLNICSKIECKEEFYISFLNSFNLLLIILLNTSGGLLSYDFIVCIFLMIMIISYIDLSRIFYLIAKKIEGLKR